MCPDNTIEITPLLMEKYDAANDGNEVQTKKETLYIIDITVFLWIIRWIYVF